MMMMMTTSIAMTNQEVMTKTWHHQGHHLTITDDAKKISPDITTHTLWVISAVCGRQSRLIPSVQHAGKSSDDNEFKKTPETSSSMNAPPMLQDPPLASDVLIPALKTAGVPRMIAPVQYPIKEEEQQPLQLKHPPMSLDSQQFTQDILHPPMISPLTLVGTIWTCESDCEVMLATCWLQKRKGKTGWWKWSRKTCLLTTIK